MSVIISSALKTGFLGGGRGGGGGGGGGRVEFGRRGISYSTSSFLLPLLLLVAIDEDNVDDTLINECGREPIKLIIHAHKVN